MDSSITSLGTACAECRCLIGEYRGMIEKWCGLNKKLIDAALSYNIDVYNRMCEECFSMQELCTRCRMSIRDHIRTHLASLV